MTAGSELEEIESVDRAGLDARDVAEGFDNVLAVLVGIPDDQWPAALAVASSSHLTLAGAHLPRLSNLLNVRASTDAFQ